MSASRTMNSKIASWDGRVAACNLPAGLTSEGLQQNRPFAAKIDPSVLEPGRGPLHARPLRHHETIGQGQKLSRFTKEPEEPDRLQTVLSVYLYPNVLKGLYASSTEALSASHPDDENLHIQLNRDSYEPAMNTLKRMSLSISKKLFGKGKQTQMEDTRLGMVWIMNPSSDHLVEELELKPSFTSRELWNLAKEKMLVLRLPLGERTVSLLVEGDPPSIRSVRTNEDFASCLFPHVPICVDVGLLCASHCRFDWFVDGRCCQSQTASGRRLDYLMSSSPAKTLRHGTEPGLVASSCYTPDESDLHKEISLMLTPQVLSDDSKAGSQSPPRHSGEGCEEAYRFQQRVQPLPENTLLRLRKQFVQSPKPESSIRVLTYNILADQNAFHKNAAPFYPYVSKEILLRKRRMPLLLHEIMSYHADILCLQEVDQIVFDNLFLPVLRQFNYQGFFTPKTGTHEGCALFWSLDRFERAMNDDCKSTLLRSLVPYPQEGERSSDDAGEWESCTDDVRALLEARQDLRAVLGTILGHHIQMVSLTTRDDKKRTLWAANTHLFYHPGASHIRLLQMYFLCRQMHQEARQRPGATILCGDFNSSLANAAGKLVVDRFVPRGFRDLQHDLDTYCWSARGPRRQPTDDRKVDDITTAFPEIRLPESFPHMVSALFEVPSFTHYIQGFFGTLDHILIDSNLLEAFRRAPMPAVRDVAVATAMPSPNMPSDHVSIICDLKFRDKEAN